MIFVHLPFHYRSIVMLFVKVPFHYRSIHYRSITKYLVPSTWYQVLGTKYLVQSMIISSFLISPLDRVQTTLFEDLKFVRHRIGWK